MLFSPPQLNPYILKPVSPDSQLKGASVKLGRAFENECCDCSL